MAIFDIKILHEAAPNNAIIYKDTIIASEDCSPIHISVVNMYDNLYSDIEHQTMEYFKKREIYDKYCFDFLKKAIIVAEKCPVIIYTGILTTECDAPCGCWGYDSHCNYHFYKERDVAECFCCSDLKIECSYHK
jgi:hypothetical protein